MFAGRDRTQNKYEYPASRIGELSAATKSSDKTTSTISPAENRRFGVNVIVVLPFE